MRATRILAPLGDLLAVLTALAVVGSPRPRWRLKTYHQIFAPNAPITPTPVFVASNAGANVGMKWE